MYIYLLLTRMIRLTLIHLLNLLNDFHLSKQTLLHLLLSLCSQQPSFHHVHLQLMFLHTFIQCIHISTLLPLCTVLFQLLFFLICLFMCLLHKYQLQVQLLIIKCFIKQTQFAFILLKGFESDDLYKLDLSSFTTLGVVADTSCSSSTIDFHLSLGIGDKNFKILLTDYDVNMSYKNCCETYFKHECDCEKLKCAYIVSLSSDSESFINNSEFVYFLSSLNSTDTSKLCHMRLGHLSTNLLTNFLCLPIYLLNMSLLNVLFAQQGKAKGCVILPPIRSTHALQILFKLICEGHHHTH